MNESIWKDIVNRTQYEHLPLITGCLFAISTLSTSRDLLYARELTALWMYAVEYGSWSIIFCIWVAAIVKLIPAQYAQSAIILSLLCIGAKASMVAIIWYIDESPGAIMLVMFSTGLLVLSFPYAILVQLASLAMWLVPALSIASFTDIVADILLCVLGGALGLSVLRKRVDTIKEIYELKHRVNALESILPMCSGCKKTRNDHGEWISIESHIEEQEEGTVVTHSLCPDCKEEHYGEHLRKLEKKAAGSNRPV